MNEPFYNIGQVSIVSQNDAITAGFEAAVAEYEAAWFTFQTAQASFDSAQSRVDTTKACMDEALVSLDEIAAEFNASSPGAPGYDELMSYLDVARDHLIAATDEHEAANGDLDIVVEQYNASVSSIDESLEIASELRRQFECSIRTGADASNDATYDTVDGVQSLSDNARHFYEKAA